MNKLTVMAWLKENELTANETDFLLTFIPSIVTLKLDSTKTPLVFGMLKKQFSTYIIEPEANYMEFNNFNSAIQKNIPNKISTKELLERMSMQGLCKPLCDSLLAEVN